MVTDAHAFARDLPLHHQVGTLEPARGRVEQPTQDSARHAEREVGDDAVPIGRKRDVAGVGVEHDDVPRPREPARQPAHELRVELDGEDVRRSFRERVGQDAAAGAELDDPIVVVDAGVGDQLCREPGVTEEVLSGVPATAPAAGCVPGHGRSRP